jgi:polyribonucleotide nucleotidyltransferase
MEDEPHDAVKLLIARMDSHPEEFKLKDPSYHDRWYNHISAINSYGNEADVAALNAKIRDVRMAEVHEQIMEELCNGPENRRKEAEDHEYERHLAASVRHMKQQQLRVGTLSSDMNPIGVGTVSPSTQLDVSRGIRFFNK